MPVQTSHGPLILSYLESMNQVLQNAVYDHKRTLAIRVDLRLPSGINSPHAPLAYDDSVISRLVESLNAQIKATHSKRRRLKKRSFPCSVRVIWVAERDSSMNYHYHIVILINNDCYDCLGDITADNIEISEHIPCGYKYLVVNE